MTRFQHGLGMAAAASLLLACGDGTGPPPPASIQVVSGTGQTAVVGSRLPNTLIVKVLDAGGRALSGVTVEWSVVAGGGTVSATAARTDATGQAQAQWTLGTAAGEQRVQAAVSGLAPAVFTATATPDRLASIKPSRDSLSFSAVGDTVRLTATVTDRHGNAIVSAQLQWSSSDTA
ncbi:MAG: Ig-like domain-containing protein, partial [Gemmatimonadetes bacterium]|nr:Ig-like domain-containing protein [Gemmatimonadota bacterium]